MTLLEEHRRWKHRQAAARFQSARVLLRGALARHLPGTRVWLYGSLLDLDRFGDGSDVDLALSRVPEGLTLEYLQSLLSSEVGREVDVCLIDKTRFREQIMAGGESWIP